MKLIEDLGMISCKNGSYKSRFGIYQCPKCLCPFETRTASVRAKKTTICKSCSAKTHGLRSHELYNVLANMKSRCYNKNTAQYKDYGGRGITVCDEWRFSFENFYDWALNNGYKKGLTIDREDNDGNYSSSNCRWVSNTIQARNTRLLRSDNTSGYRGVTFNKASNKWRAQIVVDRKKIQIGVFDHKITAVYVYDSYIIMNNLEHTQNFKIKEL